MKEEEEREEEWLEKQEKARKKYKILEQ